MVNDLYILHKTKAQKASYEPTPDVASNEVFFSSHLRDHSLYFETCLRKILLRKHIPHGEMESNNSGSEKEWEILEGEIAYSFILEILSGLHSPMLGETEVFGQFKNQMLQQKDLTNYLSPWISWIYEDVKKVRTQCLRNLGSQTYGSWVRSLMPRERALIILGAGQMCKKIYPYIQSPHHSISIVNRSPEKVKGQYSCPLLSFQNRIDLQDSAEVDVIIAAPLSQEDLRNWFENNPLKIYNYLDLRGEFDPLADVDTKGFKMGLRQFFDLQTKQKESLHVRVSEAKNYINNLSQTRFGYCFNRPWGWDDVCA
jgi:glutamyl-tRNA reductase